MVLGGPGAGKSNLCNILVGQKYFKSESSCVYGVTKEISFLERPALGINGNVILNVADLPGLCDITIPLENMIYEIKTKIGSLSFDAVIIVVKQSDYRSTIQEVVAMKIISKLMQQVEAQNLFLVLTHCDQKDPDQNFINEKLQSFQRIGGIQILPENAFKFYNNQQSLQQFIQRLIPGQIKFKEDLIKHCHQILSELPGDFKRQDQIEGTNNFSEYSQLIELMKQQNQELIEQRKLLQKKLDKQEESIELLREQIKNMPVPKGSSSRCTLI